MMPNNMSQSQVQLGRKQRADVTMSKSVLVKLRSQNEELKDQLVQQQRSNHEEERLQMQRLERIRRECEAAASRIEIERLKNDELHSLIESHVSRHEQMVGGDQSKALRRIQKEYTQKEQRHQQTLQGLNIQEAQSLEIKQELNLARRERVVHSTVVKTIEVDLKKKIQEYKQSIKRREKSDVELQILREEYSKLMATIELEDQEFKMTLNGVVRQEQQQQENILKTLQSREQAIIEEVSKPTARTDTQIKVENHVADQQELQLYEDGLRRVLNQTGAKDVDHLIRLYNSIEETNDELYREVADTNIAIEKTQEDIEELNKYVKKHELRAKVQLAKKHSAQPQVSQVRHTRSQKCDQFLEKNQQDLKEMKQDLLKIGDMVGLADINVKSAEISEWNLNVLAEEVVELCLNVIVVSDSLTPQQARFSKNPSIATLRSVTETSEDKKAFVIRASEREEKHTAQQLDELMNQLDLSKQAEKIMSAEDFMQQGMAEIQKQLHKKKQAKKSK